MKTYVVTATVEIEVEANSEKEAIMIAEESLGFDIVSFSKASAMTFDEEVEDNDY